jgi:hypothetical protein
LTHLEKQRNLFHFSSIMKFVFALFLHHSLCELLYIR